MKVGTRRIIIIIMAILVLFWAGFLGCKIWTELIGPKIVSSTWKIVSLDMPIIEEEREFYTSPNLDYLDKLSPGETMGYSQIRIATFEVLDPKGAVMHHRILQSWQESENLKGYVIGFEKTSDLNAQFRFMDNRLEIWVDSKLCKYQGEVLVNLVDNAGQVISESKTKVNFDNRFKL